MAKRIFISDIHLGARRPPVGARFPYDWLTEEEGDTLESFLRYLHDHEPHLNELVIVGDFLDIWICPHDEEPPTFAEILSANGPIIDAMNALLARGVRIVFLEGNHDMYLTKSALDTVLHPSANLEYYPEFYLSGGVYALHGHVFDPFNKRVTGDEPNLSGYPLGYFISRIVATKKALTNSSKRPIFEIIEHIVHNVLHNLGPAVAVFDALLEDAGLDEDISITMPDGTHVTVQDVQNAFVSLPASASIADLVPFVKPLAATHKAANGFKDIGLVVCGHTHGARDVELDLSDAPDDDFAYTQVYANSGTWIGSAEDPVIAPAYIEVEADNEHERMINVRLMSWENGAPHEQETKFFPLPGGEVIFTSPTPADDPSSDVD